MLDPFMYCADDDREGDGREDDRGEVMPSNEFIEALRNKLGVDDRAARRRDERRDLGLARGPREARGWNLDHRSGRG